MCALDGVLIVFEKVRGGFWSVDKGGVNGKCSVNKGGGVIFCLFYKN